jgi:energy-converting hydrogenase Eha subunit C
MDGRNPLLPEPISILLLAILGMGMVCEIASQAFLSVKRRV